MNILSQLIAAYLFENATTPYSQADYVGNRYLLAPYGVTPIIESSGKNAVQLAGNNGNLAVGQCLVRDSDATLDLKHKANTVAIRFRMDSLPIAGSGVYVLLTETPVNINLYNMAKYRVRLFWGGGDSVTALITVNGVPPPLTSVVTMNAHLLTPIKVGEWHTLFFGWDDGIRRYFVKLDDDDPLEVGLIYPTLGVTSREFVVGGNRKYGSQTIQDQCFNGAIGALYMWKRLLSRQEMDAIAGGLDYPFQAEDPGADCDAVSCCQDPEEPYSAANPTPSGFTNKPSGEEPPKPPVDRCSPVPNVAIDPPSGSYINVPSYISLSADRIDVNIYYTTDGTTPTVDSKLYTTPFLITDVSTVIKAMAVIVGEDCPPGPVTTAIYLFDATFSWKFSFLCDTPDFVGRWGVFTPSEGPDRHWRLLMHSDADRTITRIELYQTLSTSGFWNTGQAWATDEYIRPVENRGPNPFHVFPLEIWDGCSAVDVPPSCGTQQNHEYRAVYSALPAGDYIWDLYGQPTNYPLVGFFKMIIFMSDGKTYRQIIPQSCVPPPPPPCVNPAEIALTEQCLSILVAWNDAEGLPYTLERKGGPNNGPGCGTSTNWVLLASGNIAFNCIGNTYQCYTDADVKAGCTYCYRLGVKFAGCDHYTYAPVKCGSPLCVAGVSLTAAWKNLNVCGGIVTLCYSSTCVDGNITITDDHASAPLSLPGNVSGCVDIAWPGGLPPDTVKWSILGPNATCGDAFIADAAQLTEEAVFCTANDGVTRNDVYSINPNQNWDFNTCQSQQYPLELGVVWNGQLVRSQLNPCLWSIAVGPNPPLLFRSLASGGNNDYCKITDSSLYFSVDRWILKIASQDWHWTGEKLCNETPEGTYTLTDSSCTATPATITVA